MTTASLQGRKVCRARCEARAFSKSSSTLSVGMMVVAACESRRAKWAFHATHRATGERPRGWRTLVGCR
eukprot:11219346-Lingulodinium_polyedra.AAC.1